MDLYKELNLEPVRSEPDVWLSRIMILERIAPNPVIIRDISLSRGLNIIWAREAEDDSPTAMITGHSAGKTTFCRLLRYVLGERTFGTKAAMELIRKSFPEGYIAAEIHVRGRKWAVWRPFGSGRMSCIKENASLEELLQKRGRTVTQESYPQELGLESLLDNLETGGIVQTGEPIQWAHILAWCTRDQEARFQNIYDWRSPRSEADTPSFRFSKAGPLFLMRAVLGLFLPDELKGEERLAELQREKDRLTKEIEEKRREPQFRVNLYEYQLRQSLKSLLPKEPDIDSRLFRSSDLFPEDLERLTANGRKTIEVSIEDNEKECQAIQSQIDALGADLKHQERELERLDVLFDVDSASSREFDAGLSKREEQRKNFEAMRDQICPLGEVIFRNCSHIQSRRRILQITELQDARAMKQAEAQRAEECKKIEAGKNRLREAIDRIEKERKNIIRMRGTLTAHIQEQRNAMRDLERTQDQLVIWRQRRDDLGCYEELGLLRRKFNSVETEIVKVEKELSELIRQHDENRERMAGIFSAAVRSVLSSDGYNGRVRLENRELSFRITHGPAMSGEAVDTLSVLLADVSALVYNTVTDKSHLPSFLLHDSPREADLGIRIYRSFIRFAASLQEHFGEAEKCPFQYFITTTTAPPKELRTEKYVKLPLNALTTDGLLLRRNIAFQKQENISLWSN